MPRIFLLDQAALERIEGGARPGGDADLGIEALDMVVGGLGRDIELAGRFLGGMPGRDQPQDLDLARGQSGQPLGRVAAGGLTGAGEDRLDRVGAELSFPDRAAQLCGRGRIAQRGPVRPCLPRGLEGFGGGKDAGGRRKVAGLGVAVIAAAVEALVMAQHQRRDRFALAAQRRQRALAMIGMKPRRVGLAFGERAGSHPGRDRNRQLADVVRVGRPAERRECRRREDPCCLPAASASAATAREWPNVNGIRMSIMSAIAR